MNLRTIGAIQDRGDFHALPGGKLNSNEDLPAIDAFYIGWIQTALVGDVISMRVKHGKATSVLIVTHLNIAICANFFEAIQQMLILLQPDSVKSVVRTATWVRQNNVTQHYVFAQASH